jgi:hypothetical protein
MSPSLANHQGYTLHQHAKQWASNKQMKHIETKQLQNKAHTLFFFKPRNLNIAARRRFAMHLPDLQ